MSVALTISDMDEAETKRKILGMGLTGSGKTNMAKHLVEAGYGVWVISTENKLETLRPVRKNPLLSPLLKISTVKTFQFPRYPSEFQAAAADPDNASDLFDLCRRLKAGDHQSDVVFVDSGMKLVEEAMRFYTTNTVNDRNTVDTRAGYGEFGHRMNLFFDYLLSYSNPANTPRPVHVIVTWGVERADNGNEKRQLNPIVDGAMLGPKLPYKFSDVLYLAAKEGGEDTLWCAGLRQTDTYFAKCETGGVKLPAVIVGFNVAQLLQMLGHEAPKRATEVVK